MLADRYGLPISTPSERAAQAYVAGCDCLLAGSVGVRRHLAEAITADPAFALAHIALARGLFLEADVAPAREAAARARELAAGVTPRERSHVHALALAIEGNAPEALAATRAHLAEWPRDALVLAPATGVFGLIGFSGRQLRESELYELMRALAPHYGDDWWFQSQFAFAACESGRLDEALSRIERSMAANPRSGHGAHIQAHVLYEMGEARRGFEILDGWLPQFERAGLMHCHLSWHVALFALQLGMAERAWQAYRDGVHPGASWGPPLNVVTDAVSFLWRSELRGVPRQAALWREVQDYARERFPRPGVAFADLHTAVACVANEDFAALEHLVRGLHERLAAGKLAPGPVVVLLAEGFAAYAKGDWERAIADFARALPETVRIGGSRAQRDLVELTLVAAYLRAGRVEEARAAIARRGDVIVGSGVRGASRRA
jgi:tetratricopeptide (TPR) repeat protein